MRFCIKGEEGRHFPIELYEALEGHIHYWNSNQMAVALALIGGDTTQFGLLAIYMTIIIVMLHH